MVHLNTGSAAHLVSERSQFLLALASRCSQVCALCRPVLRTALSTDRAPHIVGLVFVVPFDRGFGTRVLLEGPSREVLLIRWVGRRFWHIAARTNCTRSRNQVLQTLGAATVAKGVLSSVHELRFLRNHVLGTGVRIIMGSCEARLCSYLWCTDSRSTVIVRFDGIVEEECILVKVVLWLLNSHSVSTGEGEFLRLNKN